VARLSSRGVARVSVSIDALPVVVPVLYVVDGDSILFRSPLDDALAAACNGAVIAFEVDDFATSVSADESWSVHVLGIGTRLDEQAVLLPIGRVTGTRLEQASQASVM
jgi:nitroimidazol reductase NimA-like FMN-containing flavoprotein (pyridoxamine 5'-phosphate oxidase superfamily)